MKNKLFILVFWAICLSGCAQNGDDKSPVSKDTLMNSTTSAVRNFYGYATKYRTKVTTDTSQNKGWSDWSAVDGDILVYVDWKFGVASVTNQGFERFLLVEFVGSIDIEDGSVMLMKGVDKSGVIAGIGLSLKNNGNLIFTIVYGNIEYEYFLEKTEQGYPGSYWEKKELEFKKQKQEQKPGEPATPPTKPAKQSKAEDFAFLKL